VRRHLRTLLVCAFATVLALGATACDGDGSTGSEGQGCAGCPVFDEGERVRVDVGERFVVALAANPTTGYRWDVEAIGDRSVVRARGSSYVTPDDGAPGAGGTQRLAFEGRAAGATTLTLRYARPFEPDDPTARIVTVDVTVR
jgi:inhibitor of cysteine peptidase